MNRLAFKLLLASSIGVLLCACTRPADHSWSGYVEGDYVYVAAPLAGRLTVLAAQRGQHVSRGAELFQLDVESERAASEEAAARRSAPASTSQNDSGKTSTPTSRTSSIA